eukprot:1151362-Pelagomonas_calceolata.AAC.4
MWRFCRATAEVSALELALAVLSVRQAMPSAAGAVVPPAAAAVVTAGGVSESTPRGKEISSEAAGVAPSEEAAGPGAAVRWRARN